MWQSFEETCAFSRLIDDAHFGLNLFAYAVIILKNG
jgi:hypothetical protein